MAEPDGRGDPRSAPTRSDWPRRNSRAALVEAAFEEFSQNGYEATTVAGIAERAGVTTDAFYAHFTGKLAPPARRRRQPPARRPGEGPHPRRRRAGLAELCGEGLALALGVGDPASDGGGVAAFVEDFAVAVDASVAVGKLALLRERTVLAPTTSTG